MSDTDRVNTRIEDRQWVMIFALLAGFPAFWLFMALYYRVHGMPAIIAIAAGFAAGAAGALAAIQGWRPNENSNVSSVLIAMVVVLGIIVPAISLIYGGIAQWWTQDDKDRTEVVVDFSDHTPVEKDLAKHIQLAGTFEQIKSWEIKVPESSDGVTPTRGLCIVLPPQSDHIVRIEAEPTSMPTSRLDVYTVSTDNPTPLHLEQINAFFNTRESPASKIPSLPFEDSIATGDLRPSVISLQGFSNNNPIGLQGRAMFYDSWTYNTQRSRTEKLVWKQWIVELNDASSASFVIPESGWKHIWIVPVNDPEYLPELLGVPVPLNGFSSNELPYLYRRVHNELLRIGYSAASAKEEILKIQTMLLENQATNVANPHEPFLKIGGYTTEPLKNVKTWSATHDTDVKGKEITLGININQDAVMPEPLKVIVGVSRCD